MRTYTTQKMNFFVDNVFSEIINGKLHFFAQCHKDCSQDYFNYLTRNSAHFNNCG